MLVALIEAAIAVSTLSLRGLSFIFVRHHPVGDLYLSKIYLSFATYVVGLFAGIFTDRRQPSWLVLVFGLPDRRRPRLSLATICLNTLCFLAVLDFLYRGEVLHQSSDLSFSRVGYVDESSSRVVLRAPLAPSVQIEMSVYSEESEELVFQQVTEVAEANDYTTTFVVAGLTPQTGYTYRTNASHAGSFRTSSHPKRWSLASTSCIKPFYPYDPLSHGLRIHGLEHLSDHYAMNPFDMMLFLGDFIYIDLPVPYGWSKEHYRRAYRQVYASPSWSPALRSVPWVHVYDDHEIENDWAAGETGLYKPAIAPYHDYQGAANPPSQFGPEATHFTFTRGDVAFFVLDTRRFRVDKNANDNSDKTMLGLAQRADLEKWLAQEAKWKVVVSSVPFTQNWHGNDSWAGYLLERDYLLDKMKATEGVIILSGDRHEHATTIFPAIEPSQKPVIEFSTSPLSQFFEPFTREFSEVNPATDQSVYHWPYGTSKFGIVDFDTTDPRMLKLHYKLVVDGKLHWEYDWQLQR